MHTEDLQIQIYNLNEQFAAILEEVYSLKKTIEGIQNLFIRAGEYKGKPRGRLPR